MTPTEPVPDSVPSRARRWASRALALASVALFGVGALWLARGLSHRGLVVERETDAAHGGSRERPEASTPSDPRLDAWLEPAVSFGPPREERFGAARALAYSGSSSLAPQEVFGRILARWGLATDDRARQALLDMGPSAAAALRLHASVGRFPGGAFLLRMPPEARADGRLRLEPGGVMLAFPAPHGWDYVGFHFPDGLDLEGLLRDAGARPDPRALDALPPDAAAGLEPVFTLGPFAPAGSDRGAGRGVRHVICRARGEAGAAVDRTARALEAAGWRTRSRGGEAPEDLIALDGPGGTVFVATPDRRRDGGLVTILLSRS